VIVTGGRAPPLDRTHRKLIRALSVTATQLVQLVQQPAGRVTYNRIHHHNQATHTRSHCAVDRSEAHLYPAAPSLMCLHATGMYMTTLIFATACRLSATNQDTTYGYMDWVISWRVSRPLREIGTPTLQCAHIYILGCQVAADCRHQQR
jgi:hypothetical protein